MQRRCFVSRDGRPLERKRRQSLRLSPALSSLRLVIASDMSGPGAKYLVKETVRNDQGTLNIFLHMHFWGCGFYLASDLIDQSVMGILATGRDPQERLPSRRWARALNNRKDIAGQLRVTCLGTVANG
jgi:hypothetical protein